MKNKQKDDFSGTYKKISLTIGLVFITSFFIYILSDQLVEFYSFLVFLLSGVAVALVSIPPMFITFKPFNVKNVFIIALVMFGMSIFILFGIVFSINMIRDIPYAITSKFSEEQGKCYNAHTTTGKGKSLVFKINGVEFTVSKRYKDVIDDGNLYRVEYLPNSKFVINIYK